MNNDDAFGFIVLVGCGVVVLCCLMWVIFLLFIIIDNKNGNRFSGDETAQFSTCDNGCLGIYEILCGICGPWWSCMCGLTFARSCRCSNDGCLCGMLLNGDVSIRLVVATVQVQIHSLRWYYVYVVCLYVMY